MKKIIYSTMALAIVTANVLAADRLTTTDITIPQGGTATLEVAIVSVENRYGGFQFELALPKGVTVTKVEKADRLMAINGYITRWGKTNVENNTYTILGFNMNRHSIKGEDGAIVYVTLAADADIEEGSVLQSTMNEPTITTVDLLEVISAPRTFTITIKNPNIVDEINAMSSDADPNSTSEVYDLQGMPVSKNMNTLRKGVYIVNGKKVVNK